MRHTVPPHDMSRSGARAFGPCNWDYGCPAGCCQAPGRQGGTAGNSLPGVSLDGVLNCLAPGRRGFPKPVMAAKGGEVWLRAGGPIDPVLVTRLEPSINYALSRFASLAQRATSMDVHIGPKGAAVRLTYSGGVTPAPEVRVWPRRLAAPPNYLPVAICRGFRLKRAPCKA